MKKETEKELKKVESQLEGIEENIKSLSHDELAKAPKVESEPQYRLSQKEIEKSPDTYLKPSRSIGDRQKFNEKFRDKWEFEKEYVQFIAENREIKGETIELWTHPRGGVPAEFWKVPVGVPVWGPRYLAEQIKNCKYHILKTEDRVLSDDNFGKYFGSMVVDHEEQRLDAHPVFKNKSVFMGAAGF